MIRATRWALVMALVTGTIAGEAIPSAWASTVMVIEDFAPMRMIPSARAPRKAFAPLGLLLRTRRVGAKGDFVEGTNAEQRAFEDPAWLHYWLRPSSILFEPGQTKISLDLIVHQRSGPPEQASHADFPGRGLSVAQFIADSTALPDSYYVNASDENDTSPWGGNARLLPPTAETYDPPGVAARKKALRAETQFQLYVSLAGPKLIRSVRERLAVARVLVKAPDCGDFDYIETEVVALQDWRIRKIGGPTSTVAIPIPTIELTTSESAAEVQWSRLVYVATVAYEDGSAETIARRLFVTWPHCP